MAGAGRTVLGGELHGGDDGARWIMGAYDDIPVQLRLSAELAEGLQDGGEIGGADLSALERLTTARIERGACLLGWHFAEQRRVVVVEVDTPAWEGREEYLSGRPDPAPRVQPRSTDTIQ